MQAIFEKDTCEADPQGESLTFSERPSSKVGDSRYRDSSKYIVDADRVDQEAHRLYLCTSVHSKLIGQRLSVVLS
jgi:hypothetical protein